MKNLIQPGVAGSLGSILVFFSIQPLLQAGALSLHPSSLVAQSTSQTPSSQSAAACQVMRNEASNRLVMEAIGQARLLLEAGRSREGAIALERAFRVVRALPDSRAKADWTFELLGSPTNANGLLGTLSAQARRDNQLSLVRQVLPAGLQLAQSLSSSYSLVKTNTVFSIASIHQQLGDTTQAIALLDQTQQLAAAIWGSGNQASLLVDMARSYQEMGRGDTARRLLSQTLPLATGISSAITRAYVLQNISLLYTELGDLERALQVAQLIQGQDIYQSGPLMRIAYHYGKRGNADQALAIAQRIPSNELKALALAEAAAVYAQVGQRDRATQLFNQAQATTQQITEPFSRDRSLADTIVRYAEGGQLEAARSALAAIPNPSVQIYGLGRLAIVYQAANRADAARLIVDQAIQRIRTLNSLDEQQGELQSLIDTYSYTAHYALAFQVAQAFSDDPSRGKGEVLSRVAQQSAAAGETDLALTITQTITPEWPDAKNQGYQAIALAHARAGRTEQAMVLTDIVTNGGSYPYQVDTKAAIAPLLFKQGQSQAAQTLLNQAIALASQLTDRMMQPNALAAIAIAYREIGQTQQATELQWQAVQQATAITDNAMQSTTLRQMVDRYLEAGHYLSAVEAARAIRNPDERSRTLAQAVERALSSGQDAATLQLVRSLEQPELKTRFLLAIATRSLQQSQSSAALPLLAEAFATARRIPGPESRTITLQPEYDEMGNERFTPVIEDDQDRGSLLEAIALSYGMARQYPLAVQVANTLQESRLRNALLQQLICYR